ncbi:hypothetical protein F5Y19DRAFT_471013 [Xylariaceae sp. FL1651]|nr:hypothetical protein F5Y19DRAFT_471013 [Xylariaceae sp. FL1651]
MTDSDYNSTYLGPNGVGDERYIFSGYEYFGDNNYSSRDRDSSDFSQPRAPVPPENKDLKYISLSEWRDIYEQRVARWGVKNFKKTAARFLGTSTYKLKSDDIRIRVAMRPVKLISANPESWEVSYDESTPSLQLHPAPIAPYIEIKLPQDYGGMLKQVKRADRKFLDSIEALKPGGIKQEEKAEAYGKERANEEKALSKFKTTALNAFQNFEDLRIEGFAFQIHIGSGPKNKRQIHASEPKIVYLPFPHKDCPQGLYWEPLQRGDKEFLEAWLSHWDLPKGLWEPYTVSEKKR